MSKRARRTFATKGGSTLSVGAAALPLEKAKQEIYRLFGPWMPPEKVAAMGADYANFDAYQRKYFDYYWDGNNAFATGKKWYGSYKFNTGGVGGGAYYDRPLMYYVLWARTGNQKYLDRANAMVEDLKANLFNMATGFYFSSIPGGAAISTSGTQSGTHTVSSPGKGSFALQTYGGSSGDLSPGGFCTWFENRLSVGDIVTFSTTGNLPTGVSAGVNHYVYEVTRNSWSANGGPIWWLFRGIYCHWLLTGDETDRICIGNFASQALASFYRNDIVAGNTAYNSLYGGGGSNPIDGRTQARTLETLIYAHLLQVKPVQSRTDFDVSAGVGIWKVQAKAYLDGILAAQDATGGWRYVSSGGDHVSVGYEKPFMSGMTCESLIQYYNLIEADPRIPTAIKKSCDCMWDTCFVTPATYPTSALGVTSQMGAYGDGPYTNCFRYLEGSSVDEPTSDGLGTNVAGNLNLMSINQSAWYYYVSGDVLYKDRADKIFKGWIDAGASAFFEPGQNNAQKSMNEGYAWSHRYPFYRSNTLALVGAAPVNTVAPSVSSSALTSGTVATCTTGTWTNLASSYAYQWQRSANGTTGWANISSETSSTYTIVYPTDAYLRCQVTASNAGYGAGTAATSNVIGPVTAAPTSLTYTATSSATFTDYAYTGASPVTISAQAIGAAATDRRVIASILADTGNGFSSITIGGVAATIHATTTSASGGKRAIIASAIVPTGTTADVVLTMNGGANNLGPLYVKLGTVYGANATTPVSTTGVAEFAYSAASVGPLTVPTGGVGVVALGGFWNTITLSGVTQDEEKDGGANGDMSAVFGHASSTFTATAANDAGNGSIMAAAVFQL